MDISILATCKVLLGKGDIVDPLGPSPRPSRPIEELIATIKGVHGLD